MPAKINIFEGGRRISRLLQVLWAIGTIAIFADDQPKVKVAYSVERPGQPPSRMESYSCHAGDAVETDYSRVTRNRTPYQVLLCFSPAEFTKGRLIPYVLEKDGTMWGDESYSSNVTNYKEKTLAEFRLSTIEEDWVESQRWNVALGHWKQGMLIVFSGVAGIWVIAATFGWILRGFLGVPAGKDSRQAP